MLSKLLQQAACGMLILCTSAASFAADIPRGCEMRAAAEAITKVLLQEGPVTPEEIAGEAALRQALQEQPDVFVQRILRSAEATVADYEASAALGEPEAPQVIAATQTRMARFIQKYFTQNIEPWRQWVNRRYGNRGGVLVLGAMSSSVAAPASASVGMAAGLAEAAPRFSIAELTLFFANTGRKLIFITGTALGKFIDARLAMDDSQIRLDRALERANAAVPADVSWKIYRASKLVYEQSAYEQMQDEARERPRF